LVLVLVLGPHRIAGERQPQQRDLQAFAAIDG
jgi:hypothetical protein